MYSVPIFRRLAAQAIRETTSFLFQVSCRSLQRCFNRKVSIFTLSTGSTSPLTKSRPRLSVSSHFIISVPINPNFLSLPVMGLHSLSSRLVCLCWLAFGSGGGLLYADCFGATIVLFIECPPRAYYVLLCSYVVSGRSYIRH
jgi:hypothetical protein